MCGTISRQRRVALFWNVAELPFTRLPFRTFKEVSGDLLTCFFVGHDHSAPLAPAPYEPEDQKVFPELLAALIVMLEAAPRDVLGPLYMELEIANKEAGQFFTPPDLSEMMANLTFNDELAKLESQPFVTVQERACGAGGMVLALVKVLIDAGHNPVDALWAQCTDVDRLAALMCYVQLTLWHVPAQVVVGNTPTLETREFWHTPAHHLGLWDARLKRQLACWINDRSPMCKHITGNQVTALLASKLVTQAQIQAAGLGS